MTIVAGILIFIAVMFLAGLAYIAKQLVQLSKEMDCD
jgi:hypothetical protein